MLGVRSLGLGSVKPCHCRLPVGARLPWQERCARAMLIRAQQHSNSVRTNGARPERAQQPASPSGKGPGSLLEPERAGRASNTLPPREAPLGVRAPAAAARAPTRPGTAAARRRRRCWRRAWPAAPPRVAAPARPGRWRAPPLAAPPRRAPRPRPAACAGAPAGLAREHGAHGSWLEWTIDPAPTPPSHATSQQASQCSTLSQICLLDTLYGRPPRAPRLLRRAPQPGDSSVRRGSAAHSAGRACPAARARGAGQSPRRCACVCASRPLSRPRRRRPPPAAASSAGPPTPAPSSASAARSFPAQHGSVPSQAGGGFARRLLPAYHLQQT